MAVGQSSGADRLRGWKEISAALGVDERTVKRWEASRGLPVRRVPGAPRAPVFVFRDELAGWLAGREAAADSAADAAPTGQLTQVAAARRWPWRVLAAAAGLLVTVAAAAVWVQPPPVLQPMVAPAVSDARRLAAVAAMSGRLERVSGTVQLRAALAAEAALMLERVAAAPDATPELRREAAQACLQLARVQNDTNRPSLRDSAAAAQSLARGVALVADDESAAGRWLRGRLLIEQARAAAARADADAGAQFLAVAARVLVDAPQAERETLALAEAELAIWAGAHDAARGLAEGLRQPLGGQDVEGWLRQLRVRDLAAEAAYYGGDRAAAVRLYDEALAGAETGRARWPDEPALVWAVLRQEWNLGTTLSGDGQAAAALPHLQAARDGWLALAAADVEDEALAWWSRAARLALGEALAAAGRLPEAVSELAGSLADRRLALAAAPGSVERQRAYLVGLGALGSVLGRAGRTQEACRLYAEGDALVARMQAAGALSQLDRESLLMELDSGRQLICGGGATA